jgi:PAS domain-containing protein
MQMASSRADPGDQSNQDDRVSGPLGVCFHRGAVDEALLKIIQTRSANRAFYQTFQVSLEETENRLIYELGNGQWDIPVLRTLLEEIVPLSSVFNDFEWEHDFPVIGRRVMLLNARKLQAGHHGELLVLAMEDVTERRRSEADLKAIETYAQNIVDTVREPLLILDTRAPSSTTSNWSTTFR